MTSAAADFDPVPLGPGPAADHAEASPADPPERLSPDDRFEQAAAAEADARRNRPVQLVVLAGVVLAISVAWLILSMRSHAAAETSLDRDRRQTDRLAQRAGDIELLSLRLAGGADENSVVVPAVPPLSQFERLAEESGLYQNQNFPNPREQRPSTQAEGVVRAVYTYDIRDASIARLLRFVELATTRINGMALDDIQLTPDRTAWRLRVTFVRFEAVS